MLAERGERTGGSILLAGRVVLERLKARGWFQTPPVLE